MWVIAAFLPAVFLASPPGSARAGRYHLYSCRTPAGEVAPADGWSGSAAPESAIDVHAADTCGAGGQLAASIGEQYPHLESVDGASWVFQVPKYAQLAAATLWRAGYLHGKETEQAFYQFVLKGGTNTSVFDECLYVKECRAQGDPSAPLGQLNRVVVPPGDLGPSLQVHVGCGPALPGEECANGFGDPNHFAAVIYLYAADLTLEQAAGPTANNVGGELASAPTVGGRSDVTFAASDPGAGVYQAVFGVDGSTVQRTVVNDNGGRCRDVGQTGDGTPAFLWVQPCLSAVSADIGLDTTGIANGAHHLIVSVIDAAGNSAPVLDRMITVYNPPPPGAPNGTNASATATLAVRWKSTAKSTLTSNFGALHTIVGRLTTAGGAPIGGAQIDLLATPAAAGASAVAMARPRTGADGRFTVSLPRGVSSRTLRFAYRAHLGDPLPAATRTLSLKVRVGIALTIAPRTVSVGHSILFRGRLRGGAVPAEGKQLVLEARSPGGPWIEFQVVRTDARGRFHASYRFKFPGPALYFFQVRSEPESDYPFAAGASGAVAIRER